jgi:hypothetical protein
MSEKPTPQRTVERKEREAAALKANMKRRKEQKLDSAETAAQKDPSNHA